MGGSFTLSGVLSGGGMAYDEFLGLPQSFFALGTNNGYGLTLSIRDVPTASPVPEPSTVALLGTGLLGAAGAVRRKLRV